jgi:hypothetical protein
VTSARRPGAVTVPTLTGYDGHGTIVRMKRPLLHLLPLAAIAAMLVPAAAAAAEPTHFAGGLNDPRGLEFAPNGRTLVVAEAGRGGTNSTVGECTQVPAPIGPFMGGFTARVSALGQHGGRWTVARGLASAIGPGGEVVGVGDVAFIGRRLYALVTGGGCSHANPTQPNGIYRIFRKTGEKRLVANLSRFAKTHPVENPNPADFEPDGDWYSMIAHGRSLYMVEANHGQLVRMAPDGTLHRIVDFSAEFGHVVPTVIAFHRGAFYIANLTPFPFPAGGASLWRVSLDGEVSLVMDGLTTVLGLESHDGHLYALESSAGGDTFGAPGSGRVVRVGANGHLTPVVTGLTRATGMEFRPGTDWLYISNVGFGGGPGGGEIVTARIDD